MIEQEILRLNIARKHLYDELNQVNTRLLVKNQELNELSVDQEQNLQDQSARIQENINFMQSKIVELNALCKESLYQKIKITDNIKKYTQKRESLASIFASQSRKLEQINTSNHQIEEQIKISRLQYEYLQDDIFNLDIKIQNLKKYGMEIVPEKTALQISKKQQLAQQKHELDKRIEIEKAEVGIMFNKEQKEKLLKQIEDLELKNKQMKLIAINIQDLKLQNEALSKIKNQYEWNPNLQIKQLELNQQQQEQKIYSIDREIIAIRKKSTQTLQKIQNYKNFLKKQDSLKKEKQVPDSKDGSKQVNQALLTKSKYCEIKRDLQLQQNKESVSFLENIRQLFKKRNQNNESVIIDERTYRIKKKINLFQFILVLVVIMVLLYYTHKINKKT